MNAIKQQKIDLARLLTKVTDFCLSHGQPTGLMFAGNTPAQIYRYVAFCWFTGRLSLRQENNRVVAVIFSWPDWHEHIEARHESGADQFQWTKVHKGDSMFVAEVIGDRRNVGILYQSIIEAFPHLIQLPIYTMRHNKLVRLRQNTVERFAR